MPVLVVNFCSAAVDMLRYTSKINSELAGVPFASMLTTWNATPVVRRWIAEHEVAEREYQADPALDYIANLRRMMCWGISQAFDCSDWVCVLNTDLVCGRDWLKALIEAVTVDGQMDSRLVANSLLLTPADGPHVSQRINFGVPTAATFDLSAFWALHDRLYQHKVETEDERGGWRNCATLPYLFHKRWWAYAPWAYNAQPRQEPPDRQYWQRVHDAGARFLYVRDSIAYHHEAVERLGQRPAGLECCK